MKVIIIGRNRAEFCTIKRGDEEKHWVRTRGQTYMVMPDGLTRVIQTKHGKRVDDDEIMVFSENASKPYATVSANQVCYHPSMLTGRINLEKDIIGDKAYGKHGIIARPLTEWWNKLLPFMGLIIGGIVIAWALLG